MNYTELEIVLLGFQGTSLSFPFDEETAVFKVSKKIFALVSLKRKPLAINLKCDPNDAQV